MSIERPAAVVSMLFPGKQDWADFGVAPDIIDLLPVAIYACDAEGRILWFNRRAAALWGRSPALLDAGELYCGSYRLFFDGRPISRAETPMATVLRTGEPIEGIEARIERPDGSSVWAIVQVWPVKDANGDVIGAVNCFNETTALHHTLADAALARRIEQQGILVDFTERLHRADGPEEVYEAALEAITRALDCDRASILLFDRDNIMRFVAWRGLSDSYRRAVEGHSPWTADSKDPQPLCLADIERADLGAELTRTVRAENIRALAFIPLFENGRLLGKFMVYYDTPHRFSDAEVDIALTIARQVGFSIERTRAAVSANRLAAIVESSDDAIIAKNLDGIITNWNEGAERMFGYRHDEVIGKPITILLPCDRIDEEPQILARIRSGEKIHHFETVRRRKDGGLIDISLAVSPIRDGAGRIVGASNISRDISDRKRAEAKLKQSERRLQELLAAIPAAIYTTDARGRLTYFNEPAAELAGRRPVLGSDEWCVTWKLYCPDGTPLPHDKCPMAVALQEGRPIRNAEVIAERPDGTRVPVIPYPTPLRDENGEIVGAINMLVDISERRQAETHARMLLNELNHRVKNNMQMIQSLLSGAAKQVHSAEARIIFAEASRRVAAMAAAQRVLYSTTNAAQFNAVEFLAAVCNTAQEALPANVKIVCERASGELSNDLAMPLALILNELLVNAAKHGVRKGGDLIRAGLVERADGFELYVEDCGPGFDLSEVRGRSSGLRLVEGLARQIRGRFEVEQNPTRCTLRFS
jgi:PAS domain S-box-containing protein